MLAFVVGFEVCGGCAGFSEGKEEDCEGHGFLGYRWLGGSVVMWVCLS